MSIKKKSDDCGVSYIPSGTRWGFEIPAGSTGGTRVDIGTLALFLVANHFVNGETVLIDGGVSLLWPAILICNLTGTSRPFSSILLHTRINSVLYVLL